MKYYVAYGSNLNKQQMKYRCPNAKCIGTSQLKDYELNFDIHLTVDKKRGKITKIGLWEITSEDEKNLDKYEGVTGGYYTKEYIDITLKDGTLLKNCLLYVMKKRSKCGNMPPTTQYFETCKQGFIDFGFNPKRLHTALSRTNQEELNKKSEGK